MEEDGAGIVGLTVLDGEISRWQAAGGTRLFTNFRTGDIRIQPELRAGMEYETGDRTIGVDALLNGAALTGWAPETDEIAGTIGAGLAAVMDDRLRVTLDGDARLSGGRDTYTLGVALRYAW